MSAKAPKRQSAKAPKRQSAQARAFGEREEYILPARFDDTEIPGVRPTVGYIDLCEFSPQEFAGMVLEKIGKLSPATSDVDSKTVRPGGHRIPRLGRRQFNPYEESQEFISNLVGELKNRCDNIATDDVSASLFNRDGRSGLRVVYAGNAVYSLDVWMGGFVGDCSVSFFGIRGPIRNIGGSISAWGELEFDRENLAPVLVLNDFGLLGHPSGKTRPHLSETVEAIWEVICESLENAD